jgi:hypothetical protein
MMGAVKSAIGIVGIAAVGIGAFKAAHILPQLIQSQRQDSSTAVPAVTIQWSPSPSLPQSNLNGDGRSGQPVAVTSSPGTVNATSLNWAGVVQQGQTEKSIQASWKVPSLSAGATNPNSAVAEWIGLGGMQSNALIQVGTITSPNDEGQAASTVFWENLPGNAVQLAPVPTGSIINAKITPAGQDAWRLWLSVRGESSPLVDKVVAVTPQKARAIESSADWITEAPTTSNGVAPLAPIAATTMTQVRANNVPLSQINPRTLQWIGLYSQSGQLMAAPVGGTAHNQVVVNTVYGTLPTSSTTQAIPGATWVVQSPGDGWGVTGFGGWGGFPGETQQENNQGWVTWSFNF